MRCLGLAWIVLVFAAACGSEASRGALPSSCPGADLKRDRQNCGTCGNRCGAGGSCVDGKCLFACPEGRLLCAGGCIDPMNDANHCGKCHGACPNGCVNGKCVVHCGTGAAECNGACVDVSSDDHNCGKCGVACSGDLTCVGGKCACDDDGLTACGTRCVDLASDPANCGKCGNACDKKHECKKGQCQGGGGDNGDNQGGD